MTDDPNERPRVLAMSFLAAALLSIAARLVWANVVGLTESLRPGAALDLVSVTACQLLTNLGFVFLIARLYARDMSLRALLGLRPLSLTTAILSALVGAAAEMPVAFVERYWAARFPMTEAQENDVARLLAAETLQAKVVVGLCVAILWPLGQELFYRGAIFGRLRAAHDARTVTFAVGAFYALSLASPHGLPSAAIMGLGLAALRAATGSTWAALAAHISFMTTEIVRTYRGPGDEALSVRMVGAAAALTLVAMVLLALRLTRDVPALAARSVDGPS